MSNTTEKPTDTSATKPAEKTGFFGRFFKKLDDSLKQKAETKAAEGGGCCGGSDGKGGKCC